MSATTITTEDWLTLRERLETLDLIVFNTNPYQLGIVLDLTDGLHIITWEERKSGLVLNLKNINTPVQQQLGKSPVFCYFLKSKLTNKREYLQKLLLEISRLSVSTKKKRKFSLKSKTVELNIWDMFQRVDGSYIYPVLESDGLKVLSDLYFKVGISEIIDIESSSMFESIQVDSMGYSPRPWLI